MLFRKSTEISTIILVAKVISTIFRPVWYPLLCCTFLFVFTPLAQLSWVYVSIQLAIIAMFTIVLPSAMTFVYQHIRQLNHQQKAQRINLVISYALHIMCYVAYIQYMHDARVPYLILSVIIVALCIQIACTLISFIWKVSVHAAGAGALIGAVASYGLMFRFNPLPWLCLAFFIAGVVGTSRMILRQHTLSQILIGTLIGILCGFLGILHGDLFFA